MKNTSVQKPSLKTRPISRLTTPFYLSITLYREIPSQNATPSPSRQVDVWIRAIILFEQAIRKHDIV